jgi:putative Mg2+ transporter-C (MgtC) family protein
MPIHPSWIDLAIRLALTIAAATLFGLDRSEHGRPAGWRTTLLVSLAACLAMILANRLIVTVGKSPDSFVQLDMMRLPLGILTGVGFIGAGAIIRRDDLVLGVTTAATLWFASVIGLCFGAGQIALGIAGSVLGSLALTLLRVAEERLPQHRHARLRLVVAAAAGISEHEVCTRLLAAGYRPGMPAVTYDEPGGRCEWSWDVRWTAYHADPSVPELLDGLAALDGILTLNWEPFRQTEGSLRR